MSKGNGLSGLQKLVILAPIGLLVLYGASHPASTTTTSQGAKAAPQQQETKQEEVKAPPPPPPTPAIGEEISYEYFKHVRDKAGYECRKRIKRLAEYGIRAPGVIYGTGYGDDAYLRFSRMSKRVDGDGNMDLAGDEAEAQNGAGNWVQVKYICTVNVSSLQVRDATLVRGRFVD